MKNSKIANLTILALLSFCAIVAISCIDSSPLNKAISNESELNTASKIPGFIWLDSKSAFEINFLNGNLWAIKKSIFSRAFFKDSLFMELPPTITQNKYDFLNAYTLHDNGIRVTLYPSSYLSGSSKRCYYWVLNQNGKILDSFTNDFNQAKIISQSIFGDTSYTILESQKTFGSLPGMTGNAKMAKKHILRSSYFNSTYPMSKVLKGIGRYDEIEFLKVNPRNIVIARRKNHDSLFLNIYSKKGDLHETIFLPEPFEKSYIKNITQLNRKVVVLRTKKCGKNNCTIMQIIDENRETTKEYIHPGIQSIKPGNSENRILEAVSTRPFKNGTEVKLMRFELTANDLVIDSSSLLTTEYVVSSVSKVDYSDNMALKLTVEYPLDFHLDSNTYVISGDPEYNSVKLIFSPNRNQSNLEKGGSVREVSHQRSESTKYFEYKTGESSVILSMVYRNFLNKEDISIKSKARMYFLNERCFFFDGKNVYNSSLLKIGSASEFAKAEQIMVKNYLTLN